jgi:hypothetical protein
LLHPAKSRMTAQNRKTEMAPLFFPDDFCTILFSITMIPLTR